MITIVDFITHVILLCCILTGKNVPCVGVSIGIERLFSILDQHNQAAERKIRTKDTHVYIISAHKGLLEERMRLAGELWDADIRVSLPQNYCQ